MPSYKSDLYSFCGKRSCYPGQPCTVVLLFRPLPLSKILPSVSAGNVFATPQTKPLNRDSCACIFIACSNPSCFIRAVCSTLPRNWMNVDLHRIKQPSFGESCTNFKLCKTVILYGLLNMFPTQHSPSDHQHCLANYRLLIQSLGYIGSRNPMIIKYHWKQNNINVIKISLNAASDGYQ